MARTSRKTASKPSKPKNDKPKKKANGRAPKPTMEALSDQERQKLLFQHKRKIAPLLEAKAQAGAAVTKAYELAKKEGVTKKEIELAIKLSTDEGIDAVKKEAQRTQD